MKLKFLLPVAALTFCLPFIDTQKVIVLGLGVNSDTNIKKITKKFDCLDENVLPIFGYGFIPSEYCCGATNPSYLNRTNFQNYKDAGFNLVASIYERETFNTRELHRALDLCEEFDLGYVVRDPFIYGERSYIPISSPSIQEFEDYISKSWVKEHPAFGGFGFIDEPTFYNFERIGNANKALNNSLPNTLNFTTLFPSYADHTMWCVPFDGDEWNSFQTYVNSYIEMTDPSVLCYDLYMYHVSDNNVLKKEDTSLYYKTLSFIRRKANELGIPFWVAVTSHKHGLAKVNTQKEMRWNVNTQLAYGAKGLEYYTYWPIIEQRDVFNMQGSNYLGLTTPNGVLNDNYYIIKDINSFAHAIEKVIMPSKHIGMLQFGEKISDIPSCDLLSYSLPLISVNGGNSVVGCFDNDGAKSYLAVNDSITCGIEPFTFNFFKKVNLKVTTTHEIKFYNDVYCFTEYMTAGEACLVEVL